MEPTHRWIEHTAELQLELRARSEAAIFRQAVHALRDLLEDDKEPAAGARASRTVEVEATDRGALLAEWMAELVLLAETDGLVPDEARDLVVGEDSVTAVVVGRTCAPRHRVKAVTYHDLALHRDRDGWHGNVVLDV